MTDIRAIDVGSARRRPRELRGSHCTDAIPARTYHACMRIYQIGAPQL